MIQSTKWMANRSTITILLWVMLIAPLLGEIWMTNTKLTPNWHPGQESVEKRIMPGRNHKRFFGGEEGLLEQVGTHFCPWFFQPRKEGKWAIAITQTIKRVLCQRHFCYFVAFCGILWHFVAFCGILWHFVAFCSILWHFVSYCVISWCFVVFCGVF